MSYICERHLFGCCIFIICQMNACVEKGPICRQLINMNELQRIVSYFNGLYKSYREVESGK